MYLVLIAGVLIIPAAYYIVQNWMGKLRLPDHYKFCNVWSGYGAGARIFISYGGIPFA
jgi:hypothetical protein